MLIVPSMWDELLSFILVSVTSIFISLCRTLDFNALVKAVMVVQHVKWPPPYFIKYQRPVEPLCGCFILQFFCFSSRYSCWSYQIMIKYYCLLKVVCCIVIPVMYYLNWPFLLKVITKEHSLAYLAFELRLMEKGFIHRLMIQKLLTKIPGSIGSLDLSISTW